MPRACSVCVHPERQAIDRALAGGRPLRELSALFRVSEDALTRHKAAHLPAQIAKAAEASEAAQADDLLKELRQLRAKTYSLLMAAEAAGDIRTALAGVREARGCLELLAEIEGELDRRPVVNLLLTDEWLVVRSALLEALTPYPDARQAVAAQLMLIEASNGYRG